MHRPRLLRGASAALLNLVHHGAFAQKDSADGKPKKIVAISNVINTHRRWQRRAGGDSRGRRPLGNAGH